MTVEPLDRASIIAVSNLISVSDVIVVGKFTNSYNHIEDNSSGERFVLVPLSVERVLKGSINTETLRIVYPADALKASLNLEDIERFMRDEETKYKQDIAELKMVTTNAKDTNTVVDYERARKIENRLRASQERRADAQQRRVDQIRVMAGAPNLHSGQLVLVLLKRSNAENYALVDIGTSIFVGDGIARVEHVLQMPKNEHGIPVKLPKH